MKRFLTCLLFVICFIFANGYTLNDGVLTIPSNETYTVSSGTTLTVSQIDFGDACCGKAGGRLIIERNATVNYTSSTDITINGSITNNGDLNIEGGNVTIDLGFNTGMNYYLNNYGTINISATNPTKSLLIKSDDANKLNLKDGEIFKSEGFNVKLQINHNDIYLGTFNVADGNMTIDMQSGNSTNAEQLIIDGSLTLQNGVQKLNINKSAFLDIINTSTWNEFSTELAEGAEIFIKSLDPAKKIQFTLGKNSTFTICKNPTKGGSDYGDGKYLVTMQGGSVFNYIVDEYPNNSNPYSEKDINQNGITPVYQTYGESLQSDSNWKSFFKSFIDFIRYIAGLETQRDETKVYINGAYTDTGACEDSYNNHKSELLPIELVYFKIYNETFEWHTESEYNNNYFVVEYSWNGTDWSECTDRIYSASNDGYTYFEPVPYDVMNSMFSYFRLKQVDLDGKYSYSSIIATSFKVDNPCSDDYDGYKIIINGVTYRIFNNELIYCEKDNKTIRKIVKAK